MKTKQNKKLRDKQKMKPDQFVAAVRKDKVTITNEFTFPDVALGILAGL